MQLYTTLPSETRFMTYHLLRLVFPGMYCPDICYKFTNTLQQRAASIYRVVPDHVASKSTGQYCHPYKNLYHLFISPTNSVFGAQTSPNPCIHYPSSCPVPRVL